MSSVLRLTWKTWPNLNINRSIDVGFSLFGFSKINHVHNYLCMIYAIVFIDDLFIYFTIMLNFNMV